MLDRDTRPTKEQLKSNVNASIAKLPPLSVWIEEGHIPKEAADALDALSAYLNKLGIKATRCSASLHEYLPFIEIDKSKFCLGIGFDEEDDYSDKGEPEAVRPELVFWTRDVKHPLYGDWDVYKVDEWEKAIKQVLKV